MASNRLFRAWALHLNRLSCRPVEKRLSEYGAKNQGMGLFMFRPPALHDPYKLILDHNRNKKRRAEALRERTAPSLTVELFKLCAQRFERALEV